VHPELRSIAVRLYLKRLGLDDAPILIGPWRSEVGFEGLYWLPFLKWCAQRVPNFWQRAIVVTRGGAHGLYPAAKGVDLYALRTVTEVRRENLHDWLETKLQKQTRVTGWDRAVLEDAHTRVHGPGGRYHRLHPSWMYWALAPWWDEQRGLKYLIDQTDYTPLAAPEMAIEGLPAEYVAVKFYGRSTFPWPHPEISRFVSDTVGTIAQQVPVVLLNSGHDGDDHNDIAVSGPNVFVLPKTSPTDNLAVQAAVLGKAKAFVGTYGGVAQLALRMRVPSVSFYAEWGGTAHAHLSLSSYLSKATKTPFLVGSLADTVLWRQTLGLIQGVAA